jgi:hypothetical protein
VPLGVLGPGFWARRHHHTRAQGMLCVVRCSKHLMRGAGGTVNRVLLNGRHKMLSVSVLQGHARPCSRLLTSRRKTRAGAPVMTVTVWPRSTRCLHTSMERVAWPRP